MAIQRRLLPVHRSLFVESNPIPVKWAVARLGHCGATMRLPLTQLRRKITRWWNRLCKALACSNSAVCHFFLKVAAH